jgi:S1-C subfamily serine protease
LTNDPTETRTMNVRRVLLLALASGLGLTSPSPADGPPRPPSKDLTFRPTVIVIRGNSQGSGTVIASVPGETLVLTAAHVLAGAEQPYVEIHRQNFGLERLGAGEGWPRKIEARIAAIDRAADLAVLRVGGLGAMPFVARVDPDRGEPEVGEVVVSVGIDRGTNFASWGTRIVEYTRIDMGKGGGERPFLLTEKTPEHGRSGGALFRTDGTVVGVCVGRAEVINGRRVGIFASPQSIRTILRQHDLDETVARSTARRLPRSTQSERTRRNEPAPPAPTPSPPPAR